MDGASLIVLLSVCIGAVAAIMYAMQVLKIKIEGGDDSTPLLDVEGAHKTGVTQKLISISSSIEEGAEAFLFAEYLFIGCFMVVFALIIGVTLPNNSWATAVAFVWGGLTSIIAGYIGMKIAVKANVRTTKQAMKGWGPAFLTAFQGGAVMGFALVSLGLINLMILISIMDAWISGKANLVQRFEAIAGYGLGGSTMALFGRVGGGIYTKAADVGADLVGKVEEDIPEDDPRNPGVIADNVGDNVGDIAGMGADLFGSFAEATCAALVVSANSQVLSTHDNAMLFPLLVSAVGMMVCVVTSVIPMFYPVNAESDIEKQLKIQLAVSTILNTPMVYVIAHGYLPDKFDIQGLSCTNTDVFVCVITGLWAGLLIGFITEFYTSHSYKPVREVADSCRTGAATNIIYGLALGYQSAIIPVIALGITSWVSFHLANQYGVAMAALGMLSTLSVGLTIDGYGPISDNAGGIAEMAGLGPDVRARTDALDAAGNTTAAIGKGFAIGSAALVSLALFSAYTVRAQITDISILRPAVFSGLLIGAMLPYWFSALTMKSVGIAALSMVEEVRHQFATIPGLREGTAEPDYKRCVEISTKASLREMLPPGALVIVTPLLVGYLFGKEALAGLLIGALTSGVQMAISSSNTGGAWDNAKKYVEKGNLGGKGSDCHKAAVIGDTVGDPLKDTSGPSLNILIKLMAILSLVFADFIAKSGGVIHV